jgi:predicted Zn-dependent peptidase
VTLSLTQSISPLSQRLPNGLEVIAQPMPARSVAVGVFVRSGAREDAIPGTAHFLEHMMFKGASGLKALELNRAFDAIGASANAFTSHEHTVYSAAALPETQSRLTQLLLGMMRPDLEPSDVELERTVILEEIELYRDDPMSVAMERSAAAYYGAHPLGRSVIGSTESVSSVSQSDLRGHLEANYHASNLVLVACGAVNWEQLLEDVSSFPAVGVQHAVPLYPSTFTPRAGLEIVQHDSALVQIALIAPGFPARHPLELPAAIASRIIGDAENSRFSWALVDDGTVLSASLDHEGHRDVGSFYGSFECAPEDVGETLERVQNELARVKREGIAASELERMKRKLEVGLAMRLETPSAWLGAFGEDYVLQNDLRDPDAVLEELRGVTLEQVNDAVQASGIESPFVLALGNDLAL